MTAPAAFRSRATALASNLDRAGDSLGLIARFLFVAILFGYFWASGLTKLGDGAFGLFMPSLNAYAQIFPKAMEATGYDVSQLSAWHTIVVLVGTWSEFLLPILIAIGLATRLAALGMIGFVVVQSVTDLIGHGLLSEPEAVGTWFDRVPDAVIMDQRALWVFLLLVLVLKGGGPLSLDRLILRRMGGS